MTARIGLSRLEHHLSRPFLGIGKWIFKERAACAHATPELAFVLADGAILMPNGAGPAP